MSAEPKKLGDSLGLEVQLGDGAANVASTRVFAILRELDGTNIGTEFELVHVGDGKYTDETRVMPDFSKLTVTYFIRRVDGTSPSIFYVPNVLSEQFVKDVTGQIVEDNLDAQVSSISSGGSSNLNFDLEGTVQPDVYLVGELDTLDIEGTINEDDIIEGEIPNES